MSPPDAGPPGRVTGSRATLLFDDDCASCWHVVDRMHRWGALDGVRVTPWQWVAEERMPAPGPGREIVYVGGAEVLGGASALTACLADGGRGWPLVGRVLRLPLIRRVVAVAYRLVIVKRHCAPAGAPSDRSRRRSGPTDPGSG